MIWIYKDKKAPSETSNNIFQSQIVYGTGKSDSSLNGVGYALPL